jgi:hypothetical protein
VHQPGIIADEDRTAGEAGRHLGQAECADEVNRLGQRSQQRGGHGTLRLAGAGKDDRLCVG